MSTRAWYEYCVLDSETGHAALSMSFYKWGDATPENALVELRFFKKIQTKIGGAFPVYLLDDMLQEQLGPAYEELPAGFSTACYLFLLQRAAEELSWWKAERYRGIPREERPDYKYGFEIGRAIERHGFPTDDHDDKFIALANDFIASGKYVRPWAHYCLKFNVLQWIQILTQDTLELDMGSIARSFDAPSDMNFIHRYFIFVSHGHAPRRIADIRLQVCDESGIDVFSDEALEKWSAGYADEWFRSMRADLLQQFEKAEEQPYSLKEALQTYQIEQSFLGNEFRRRRKRISLPEFRGHHT